MCRGEYWEPDCPGSVATAVGAAFQTQGMYVMSDIVYQFTANGMEIWAPVLYIMAAFSGLIMMAIGQPPKLYLWFFIGPAIYNWTLFNTVEIQGTAWNVAGVPQKQSEVWKLAEVGLVNTNLVQNDLSATDDFGSPFGISGGTDVDFQDGPSGRIAVPSLFVWWDTLISGEMQNLSSWTGIYNQKQNANTGNTHAEPEDVVENADDGGADRAWHILTNSKWPMLENVTAAMVHNQDLREAFVVFTASECGDILFSNIDNASYIAAAQAKGQYLPRSVWKDGALASDSEGYKRFANTVIPAPISYVNLLRMPSGDAYVSFRQFLERQGLDDAEQFQGKFRTVNCAQYFWVLMQGFRHEAAQVYNQLVREAADHQLTEDQVVYNFLYGWQIDDLDGELQPTGNVVQLNMEEQKGFVQDLVLLHLIRNEIAFAQNPVNERWSATERSVDYTQAYQRNVGSKSKYGELYTWAKMMPYIQGVLLYMLAIAYPFCCLVLVIPGWWKTIFTWMAFWAWAKSWDFGFAIVQTLERSIWAMVGNHQDAGVLNARIFDMQDRFGWYYIACDGDLGCAKPRVVSDMPQSIEEALGLFDFALLMAGNLDMDLANSYYIYLMSALYFAVPAVTGQVLLGAKAGASSMVNTMVGGVASETGKAAGSGYTGQIATQGHNNFAAMGQTQFAKGLRQAEGDSNFLNKAYGAKNAGLQQEMAGSMFGTVASGLGAQTGTLEDNKAGDMARAGHVSAFAATGGKVAYSAAKGGGAAPGAGATSGGGRGAVASSGGGGGAGASSGGGMHSGEGDLSFGGGPGAASQGGPGVQHSPTMTQVAGNKAAGPLAHLGAGLGSLGSAGYGVQRQDQLGLAKEGLNRKAAGARAASFTQGSLARGNQMMGGRYDAAAQQYGGEQQWRAMRNLSAQFTGKASAMGVFAGAFVAGPKPMQMDGMAGMGMLQGYESDGSGRTKSSHDFQGMFGYPAQGYTGQVRKATGHVNSTVGSGASGYTYMPNTWSNVGGQMIGAAGSPEGNIRPTFGDPPSRTQKQQARTATDLGYRAAGTAKRDRD